MTYNIATQEYVNAVIYVMDTIFILIILIIISTSYFYGYRVISFMFEEKARERDRKVFEKLRNAQGPHSIVIEQERTQRILKKLEEDVIVVAGVVDPPIAAAPAAAVAEKK